MLAITPSVQSPKAWDRQNLTVSGMRSRLSDQGYLFRLTDEEAAFGLTVADVYLGYNPDDVRRHKTVGDGVADDTDALLQAIGCMPDDGGVLKFGKGEIYRINADNLLGLLFSGKTNFTIKGNGATIKALDGTAVVGGYGMIYFLDCTDGEVSGLTIDGNRAGRTPIEAGAYNLQFLDNCARITCRRVRSINAVIDCINLVSGTDDVATYPTDITLVDCVCDNAYRVGLSPIVSVRLKVIRGKVTNTNGTSPKAGIDAEPDSFFSVGNVDLLIDGTEVSGNEWAGIVVTGPNTAVNSGVTIRNVRLRNNGRVALHVAQATDVELENLRVYDHVGYASFGLVSVGDPTGSVSDVRIRGIKYTGITSTAAVACLYLHSNVSGVVQVDDIKANTFACPLIVGAAVFEGRRIRGTAGTSTSPAINVSSALSSIRDLVLDTITGTPLYVTGADFCLDGARMIDYGASASASIQYEAGSTGSITRNVDFTQRTSIPASTYAIRYNGVAPRILENITGKSAGTDFTAANLIGFLSGTTGSIIRNLAPDIYFASATWDPASIANGSYTSTTFTVTGAALGDYAYASPGVDIGSLAYSAQVTSANTVTVMLLNNTGGAVDIGSSTWKVRVEKR